MKNYHTFIKTFCEKQWSFSDSCYSFEEKSTRIKNENEDFFMSRLYSFSHNKTESFRMSYGSVKEDFKKSKIQSHIKHHIKV